MDRLPIVWNSNAPWTPIGYGQQTALFAPRVAREYDLRICAFYGLQGSRLTWNGIEVLPCDMNSFGNEALLHHAQHSFGDPKAGLVFTLMDVWVIDHQVARQLNMACWCPVDHDPVQPGVREFFRETGAVPIAMSRFGERQLEEFDPLYVPHGVDTTVYRPIPRVEAREAVGFEQDVFVVGMVAANKGGRKHIPAALRAFAELAKLHDDVRLYLHTEVQGSRSEGIDLLPLIEALDIPRHMIHVPTPYTIRYDPLDPGEMASFYSSMDVLLSASAGEGFGIPVIEAAACGVPSIVTDFSAQPEVVGPAGWRVGHDLIWTGQKSWQANPHVADIVEALEDCYEMSRWEREEMSQRARTHAGQYDVERVMTEHMLPALERVQERIGERDRPVKLKRRVAV